MKPTIDVCLDRKANAANTIIAYVVLSSAILYSIHSIKWTYILNYLNYHFSMPLLCSHTQTIHWLALFYALLLLAHFSSFFFFQRKKNTIQIQCVCSSIYTLVYDMIRYDWFVMCIWFVSFRFVLCFCFSIFLFV